MQVTWSGPGAIRLNGRKRQPGAVWTMTDVEYRVTRRILGDELEPVEEGEDGRHEKEGGQDGTRRKA